MIGTAAGADTVLIVRKPGPLSLIQDLGRFGYFRHGLTRGGPADELSFRWANRLCGNRANTSALEIVAGGVELEATGDCQIALAGAATDATSDGRALRPWASHQLRAGDILTIPPLRNGLVTYLAVRGGFQIPAQFGSTATVVRERMGGLNGASLAAGDRLPLRVSSGEANFYLPASLQPSFDTDSIALVPGWQYDDMPRDLKRAFFSHRFTLSADSNRMGIRFDGTPLPATEALPRAMISEGIVAGSVQIPPAGLPIVMMADHQTLGGYPKIGTVATVARWQLAQQRPGTGLRFAPVSATRALGLLHRALKHFEATLPYRA